MGASSQEIASVQEEENAGSFANQLFMVEEKFKLAKGSPYKQAVHSKPSE